MKPSGEVLHRNEWTVRPVDISLARSLIARLHYARGASNSATAVHGLFKADEPILGQCYGVAWWIPPTRDAAAAWWPEPTEVLALSRLVLEDDVPKNGASFLISQSIRLLHPRWKCLITYADSWQGHDGGIYKATNWEYLGLTNAERTYVINGVMKSRKAGPRTYTHDEMLARGAELVGSYAKHRFRYIRKTR